MEKLFSKKASPSQVAKKTNHSRPNPKQFQSKVPDIAIGSHANSSNLSKRPPARNEEKQMQKKDSIKVQESAFKSKSGLQDIEDSLTASKFRLLNEMLYTIPSEESQAYFSDRKADMEAYHSGFRKQTARWPISPVEVVLEHVANNAEKFKQK